MKQLLLFVFISAAFGATRLEADSFSFTTGSPDGRSATASRPESPGKIEIESADDFVITNSPTQINSATFTGLLPSGANVGEVRVEIYRVFPNDSDVGRTSGPPTFSTSQVPTRVNSPSDVEFADRDTATGNLTFTTNVLSQSFTAANSILNGINPFPNQHTGGEGAVTGQEVQFNVNFTTPFNLPANHYFFVPQVEVTNGGDFLWLSVARPIVAPGTPFPAGFTDLQAWIRNEDLAPDWLRQGTDIIGGGPPAPTFNEAFSLAGTVPDSGSTVLLFSSTLAVLFYLRRRVCSAR
jgi:VPDSG-CTERM motif